VMHMGIWGSWGWEVEIGEEDLRASEWEEAGVR